MSRLQKLHIRDATYVADPTYGVNVYHVKDPHALIQAAGYIKYIFAHEHGEAIFFRGQTKLYPGLVPSLFRGCKAIKSLANRTGTLNKYIKDVRSKVDIYNGLNEAVHEPLLQHYGIKTTWVDLVDNIWIALWFSCNRALCSGTYSQYMHFEKRSIAINTHTIEYAYIVLIGAELSQMDNNVPGRYQGRNTELIDLRMAAPSIFLRPHSQHGVLFRARGNSTSRPQDYSSFIRGIIRVSLQDALNWLGEGTLLNVHSLFPPPHYDRGYSFLLSCGFPKSKVIGSVNYIGA